MWRKALTCAGVALQPWRMLASRRSSSVSSAVNSILLRSLKEHYLEVSKMTPPPVTHTLSLSLHIHTYTYMYLYVYMWKVDPPSPFTVVKGSLDSVGPVLKRTFGDEEISIQVMRLANIIPGGGGDDDDDDGINQLFVHVDVSKPGQKDSLHFLCGLYPDALGIHSVSMRPNLQSSGFLMVPSKYNGPVFQDLDEKMRDALHGFIEERGINESLFPFLQAWLYVKDHRKLMRWFKTVGLVVSESKEASDA